MPEKEEVYDTYIHIIIKYGNSPILNNQSEESIWQ